jgi:hypothetical protein
MIANDASRRSKIKNVIRVSSGNFLEMYDFIVFGYYAAAIGRTFFPGDSPYASLMLSLMTFGAGFLMRPSRSDCFGRLHRSRGAPCRADPDPRTDVDRNSAHCYLARLCNARFARTVSYSNKPSDPRFLGRGRTRRSVGLSFRDRDTGAQGVLCELAISQPTGSRDVLGPNRRGS